MKKIIALALVLVMLFALSACGREDAPAATEAPVEATVEPTAEPTPEPTAEPTPEPTPTGIEPDSGMYTITSDVNGISFEYDSKYVAMQNPVGNITVFAGADAEMPYCTVSLMIDTDAVSYLNDIAAAAMIELEGAIKTAPAEPTAVQFGENGEKEVYYVYYTFDSADLGAVVACAYYAETLESGETIVYSYSALEDSTVEVEGIVKHAIETFELAA